jgi:hypothetical protein
MNSPITVSQHTFHQEKQQLFSQFHNTLFSDENTNSISKFHFSSGKTLKICFSFYCIIPGLNTVIPFIPEAEEAFQP